MGFRRSTTSQYVVLVVSCHTYVKNKYVKNTRKRGKKKNHKTLLVTPMSVSRTWFVLGHLHCCICDDWINLKCGMSKHLLHKKAAKHCAAGGTASGYAESNL